MLSVENVRLGDVRVPRLYKHRLDAVLNVFDGYFPVLDLGAEIRRHAKREKLESASVIQLVERIERLGNGVDYFVDVKLDDLVVSVNYLIHGILRSKKFRTQLLYYSVRKMSIPFYNILWSFLAKYYRRTQYIVAEKMYKILSNINLVDIRREYFRVFTHLGVGGCGEPLDEGAALVPKLL